jgi:hypothetical protein
LANSLVDLLQCETVRACRCQRFIDKNTIILVGLLELLLGVIFNLELQGRRLGPRLLFLLLSCSSLRIRAFGAVLILGLPRLVLALLWTVDSVFRQGVFPRPSDFALDRRLNGRCLRQRLLGHFLLLLLKQALFSL